jgi:hypothetical protein
MFSTILLPPRAQLCIRYCSNKQQQQDQSESFRFKRAAFYSGVLGSIPNRVLGVIPNNKSTGTGAAAAPSKFTQVSVVTTCPSHPSHCGVARDGNGNVIVTDRHRIRKVSPDGSVSTLAGSGRLRRRPPAGRRQAFFLHVPWQWMATSSSQTTAKHVLFMCGTVCVCTEAQCNKAGNGAYELKLQLFTTCLEHRPSRTNAVLKIPP